MLQHVQKGDHIRLPGKVVAVFGKKGGIQHDVRFERRFIIGTAIVEIQAGVGEIFFRNRGRATDIENARRPTKVLCPVPDGAGDNVELHRSVQVPLGVRELLDQILRMDRNFGLLIIR